jgi:hypothetical protein
MTDGIVKVPVGVLLFGYSLCFSILREWRSMVLFNHLTGVLSIPIRPTSCVRRVLTGFLSTLDHSCEVLQVFEVSWSSSLTDPTIHYPTFSLLLFILSIGVRDVCCTGSWNFYECDLAGERLNGLRK